MKKKKRKLPGSFTILYLILIAIAVLTFIVPSGEYYYDCGNGQEGIMYTNPDDGSEQYVCPKDETAALELQAAQTTGESVDASRYTTDSASYEYREIEQEPQGVWQVLNAPILGLYDAIDISLFVLVIGGFLNIVIKTGAMDAGINSLLFKFKGRELWLIPILMILFSIGGTTYGMAEETIAFYLVIVPIFYRAGFDAATGFQIIMLGAGGGVLASTINPFAIGVASDAAGVGIGDGIINRFIFWLIITAVMILYVLWYAKRVKKDSSKSMVADLKPDHDREFLKQSNDSTTLNTPQKVILTLFALSFVLMIISVIPWEEFGITIFVSMADFINKSQILSGSAGVVALGQWFFTELSSLFLIMAIIIGIYAKKTGVLKEGFIDTFLDGCKDLLSVALIIGLARGVQVLMSSSGMDATLLYYGSQALQNLGETFFIWGAFIFYIPMSFLIPSTSGLAAATIPVMAPLGEFIYGGPDGAVQIITAFTTACGLVNLVTPTSGVVVGGLALSRIPYGKWVKHIFPLLILLSVIVLIYLTFVNLTGFYV